MVFFSKGSFCHENNSEIKQKKFKLIVTYESRMNVNSFQDHEYVTQILTMAKYWPSRPKTDQVG